MYIPVLFPAFMVEVVREACCVVVVIVIKDCFGSVVLIVDLVSADDICQIAVGSADKILWLD